LSACACVHYADIYVAFPDGSLKRPDIAIFCREPEAEAVIEVISQGYEFKDLELGPMFYLSQGVKDVVVLDPRSKAIILEAGWCGSARVACEDSTRVWLRMSGLNHPVISTRFLCRRARFEHELSRSRVAYCLLLECLGSASNVRDEKIRNSSTRLKVWVTMILT
jgi:Putative restriction endonuclease